MIILTVRYFTSALCYMYCTSVHAVCGMFFLQLRCLFINAMFFISPIVYESDAVQEYSEQTDRDYRDHPAVIPLGAYL